MAVKVHDVNSIRKAKRWNEKDDAALCVLLKRKLRDIDIALRESETPYERARLKETKTHYKQMLKKVEAGAYNGDIIFAELKASAGLMYDQAYQTVNYSDPKKAKEYVNSYENMDFDYETAFRKTRYYGIALPLIMTLLTLLFLFVFIMGAFLPTDIKENAEYSGININAMFSYRLGTDFDIAVTNDGNWPSGTFSKTKPTPDKQWEDAAGNVPETVRLYTDLGMTSVDISAFDIVMAWFHTPMLENTRIDFLEDLPFLQGSSYYNIIFLEGKTDDLKIQKDENGNYDFSSIYRFLGVYGTIICLLIAFILGLVGLIMCIIRLFTYTTRKVHIINILCLIFSLLAMISPAFATVEGTELGASFSNYFMSLTNSAGYLESETASAGVGILFLVPSVIAIINMVLPKIFHNRLKNRITYVPKGNKPRYDMAKGKKNKRK